MFTTTKRNISKADTHKTFKTRYPGNATITTLPPPYPNTPSIHARTHARARVIKEKRNEEHVRTQQKNLYEITDKSYRRKGKSYLKKNMLVVYLIF